MPHLTLEYTAGITKPIEPATLFAPLHQILANVAAIDINNCKSRAIRLDKYFVADGKADIPFVHLHIRFFGGQSIALKKEIAQKSAAHLAAYFAESNAQITVEISDIQRESYVKITP